MVMAPIRKQELWFVEIFNKSNQRKKRVLIHFRSHVSNLSFNCLFTRLVSGKLGCVYGIPLCISSRRSGRLLPISECSCSVKIGSTTNCLETQESSIRTKDIAQGMGGRKRSKTRAFTVRYPTRKSKTCKS